MSRVPEQVQRCGGRPVRNHRQAYRQDVADVGAFPAADAGWPNAVIAPNDASAAPNAVSL
jgi:hypothetical protein